MESCNPVNFVSTQSPTMNIQCEDAWRTLTEKEKMFCFYFTKACWEGQKICIFSEILRITCLKYFVNNSVFTRYARTKENDQLITYTAAVFNNTGNYLSFGDSKFNPQISKDKFLAFLRNCEYYYEYTETIENLWVLINLEVYAENAPYSKIRYYEDGKDSAYYSSNVTKGEIEFVNRFLKFEPTLQGVIAPLNTRLVKNSNESLELRIHSSNKSFDASMSTSFSFEGVDIILAFGGFSFIADRVIYYLKLAKFYASNDREKKMIELQIKHFTSSYVDEFKNAMIEWVLNKNPNIEIQIGFHERYLDPCEFRAEYQAFCTITDKEKSKTLSTLIENSSLIIEHFPWSKEFEKDSYSKANFACLDVISFAGSIVLQGQLLPNFEDIRANYGFKNFFFKNSMNKTCYRYCKNFEL